MTYKKIENNANLIRDSKNNAILSTNKEEIQKYQNLKRIKENKNNQLNNLENRVKVLEKAIEDLSYIVNQMSSMQERKR